MKKLYVILAMIFLVLYPLRAQDFEAGNKIIVQVKPVVLDKGAGVLRYQYVISSSSESKQNVWNFMIIFGFSRDSILRVFSVPNWLEPGIPLDGPPYWVSWSAPDGYDVLPGRSQSGFTFETRFLPGITDYYAEGYHELPNFPEGMAPDSIPGYTDLTPYGPGIVGRTVGPVMAPDPFDPIGFLDMLLSYTAQSDTLGWIADQTTTDKYTGYLSSAKTSLQNNNVSAARTTLRQVLQDVNVDSSSTLTSEAYALLRYNTEYLLSKLPAPPTITGLKPAMTLAGSGAFTLTVSGTNFEEGSTVNWNGSGRTTTFVADTVLRASILASDVAVVDSPQVTVKNGDGSESNGLRFYVISALAWIDTLISYKHRAYDKGWITNQGTANSLDQKLENARRQLEQGNSKAAKNILAAFVNEVEAQKGKHLSSEAYALLRFNAEYLISQL